MSTINYTITYTRDIIIILIFFQYLLNVKSFNFVSKPLFHCQFCFINFIELLYTPFPPFVTCLGLDNVNHHFFFPFLDNSCQINLVGTKNFYRL